MKTNCFAYLKETKFIFCLLICLFFTTALFWETQFLSPAHFAMPKTVYKCLDLTTTQKKSSGWEGTEDGPQVKYLLSPLQESKNKQMQFVIFTLLTRLPWALQAKIAAKSLLHLPAVLCLKGMYWLTEWLN